VRRRDFILGLAITWCFIPQVEAANIKRQLSAGAIEITGQVVIGDDVRFNSIISAMPAGGVVFLESPGGNPIPAMAIGRLIRAHGMPKTSEEYEFLQALAEEVVAHIAPGGQDKASGA
jgi:hypothetical protein